MPARGERAPEERLTHRNGYRARTWATRAGEIELAIPKMRRGSYFPSFLEPRRRSEQALVSVVQEAYVAGVSTRKVDQVVESLGLRISKSEVSRICAGPRRAGRRVPQPAARGPLPLPVARRQGREGPRRRPRRPEGAGARLRRARVRLPRGDRPRRRRGRDRGVLAQLPPRPGRARPHRRAARRLRRARRAEEGDRAGARLPLAALHRPLPPRSARPRPPRAAADAGRADPPDLQRRQRRAGARARSARRSSGCASRCRRSPSCSRRPRTTCSPSTPSPPTTGRSCARPTRSSASTARSAAAPTSSGSSPTTAR